MQQHAANRCLSLMERSRAGQACEQGLQRMGSCVGKGWLDMNRKQSHQLKLNLVLPRNSMFFSSSLVQRQQKYPFNQWKLKEHLLCYVFLLETQQWQLSFGCLMFALFQIWNGI